MKILNIAKAALYGIFLNYYCYYVLRGRFIPGGTILFLGIAGLCVAIDAIYRRYIYVGTEIRCWLMYAVLSFITTAFITGPTGGMGFASDIIKYVQRLAIIAMVAYICEREDSIRFGLRLMAVTAVGLAIAVLMVTGDIRLKLDITSGANLSQNDTGAILAFGCFALMYAWGKRKRTSLVLSTLKTAGIVLCLVVIFLSGSRKSIMAVGLMFAILLILCSRDYYHRLDGRRFLVFLTIGIVVYLIAVNILLP